MTVKGVAGPSAPASSSSGADDGAGQDFAAMFSKMQAEGAQTLAQQSQITQYQDHHSMLLKLASNRLTQ